MGMSDPALSGRLRRLRKMLKVELIFDPDCPNVNETRKNLTLAFERLELEPIWQELSAPEYVQKYGSPTILLNGKDLTPDFRELNSNSCRLYDDNKGGLQRSPSVDDICKYLKTRII